VITKFDTSPQLMI